MYTPLQLTAEIHPRHTIYMAKVFVTNKKRIPLSYIYFQRCLVLNQTYVAECLCLISEQVKETFCPVLGPKVSGGGIIFGARCPINDDMNLPLLAWHFGGAAPFTRSFKKTVITAVHRVFKMTVPSTIHIILKIYFLIVAITVLLNYYSLLNKEKTQFGLVRTPVSNGE